MLENDSRCFLVTCVCICSMDSPARLLKTEELV